MKKAGKITDKARIDLLEEEALVGVVIFGRIARGESPLTGIPTIRRAIDAVINARASSKAKR